MEDYYQILGVSPEASSEEIRQRYHYLAFVHHPDRFGNPEYRKKAEEEFKLIKEAYEVISDPVGRSEYDRRLQKAPDRSSKPVSPNPMVSPGAMNFGSLHRGEQLTQILKVDNSGGPAAQINFTYSEQDSWFKITRIQPASETEPCPIEVDVTVDTESLTTAKTYRGWIEVDFDGVKARVNLMLHLVAARHPVVQRPSLPAVLGYARKIVAFGLLVCLPLALALNLTLNWKGALDTIEARNVVTPSVFATLAMPTSSARGASAIAHEPTMTEAAETTLQSSGPPASHSANAPTRVEPRAWNIASQAVVTASSVLPQENVPPFGLLRYDPSNAVDGDRSTSWVEGVPGAGTGEWLRLDFGHEVCVVKVGVDIGYDRDDRIFYRNNRVRAIALDLSEGIARHVEFNDQRGMQYVELPCIVTTSIVAKIEDIFPGSKYRDTCIAEVEVWGWEIP